MNKAEREKLRERFSDNREFNLGKKSLFWGLIVLNINIKRRHYIACLVHSALLGFYANGIELLQQNLLTNPSYYGYNASDAAQYNSFITVEDLIIKILATPFFGFYVDRLGRQKMVFIGYSLVVLATLLFPLRHYTSFFSSLGWYFGVRFIYSSGGSILPIIPIVADYVDNASKGKAIGISCLLITLGNAVSTFLISFLSTHDEFITYMVFAAIVTVLGFGYASFLKPGNAYYKTPRTSCEVETSHQLMMSFDNSSARSKRISMIKKDCMTKPWILVSYIFAFMNGTTTAITAQILNLFVQSFPNSQKYGATVVLHSNIASTVVSVLVGPALDKINPIYIAVLSFISAMFGFVSIWAVKDPRDFMMTAVSVSIGIAFACSLMLTKYLGFKNYRTSIRGILFSIANMLLMIGVTFTGIIGGNLFKYLGRNWPFYIGGACCILCMFLFLTVYFKKIRPQEKEKSINGKVVPLMKESANEIYMEELDEEGSPVDLDKDMLNNMTKPIETSSPSKNQPNSESQRFS